MQVNRIMPLPNFLPVEQEEKLSADEKILRVTEIFKKLQESSLEEITNIADALGPVYAKQILDNPHHININSLIATIRKITVQILYNKIEKYKELEEKRIQPLLADTDEILKFNPDLDLLVQSPAREFKHPVLHLAMKINDHLTEKLLRAGANPNQMGTVEEKGHPKPFTTPLLQLNYCGDDRSSTMKLLLRYNADPNLECAHGTPLLVAVSLNKESHVNTLINHKANVNQRFYHIDKIGERIFVTCETPLNRVIKENRLHASQTRLNIISRLIQAGAKEISPEELRKIEGDAEDQISKYQKNLI